MTTNARGPVISLMLAVSDAAAAARWYEGALGATPLWDLGSVVGLAVAGAPFYLGEPQNNGWDTPAALGSRTVRIEVFVDDPDGFIKRAVAAGADGSIDAFRDHETPWRIHRQGGFLDPFGHLWLVGDRSPLSSHGALWDPFAQANRPSLSEPRSVDRVCYWRVRVKLPRPAPRLACMRTTSMTRATPWWCGSWVCSTSGHCS
jgi:PhnB protein